MIFDVKAVPLSEMIVVGKYECFVMMSIHYSGVTGNENADFTRCAARKAMDMHECN